ncbi:MAG TPA: hypothetical protein VFM55_01790 [Micromonosporaceae bacterium]|nr:hypothetical protein [Micromonosporaceae bacterium]
MPLPSKRLKQDLADDLDHHASTRWPQLGEVVVRWRGGYGYVLGYPDTDDEPTHDDAIPLCRLGYLGDEHLWGFALYDPATDTYQDTVLPHGSSTGSPQEALDCACAVHLTGLPDRTPEPL